MRNLVIALSLLLTVSFIADAKIVFQSNRADGQTYDIYVMDDDGSNVQRLTDNQVTDAFPRWSPDSLHIVFDRSSEDHQTSDVFVMNRNGTDPQNITNSPTLNVLPSWSPDGRSIAFVSATDDTPWNIYTINLLTDEVKRLTRNTEHEDGGAYYPDFSPDGRHIVYTQSTPRMWRTLHTMQADGTRQNELIPSDGVFRNAPRWSPDGTKILYVEKDYGPNLEKLSNRVIIDGWRFRERRVLKTPGNWSAQTFSWAGTNAVLIAAEELDSPDRQRDIYRYDLATDTITNLTNSPGHDYGQDWIRDSIYSVSPAGKIATLWGTLKKNRRTGTPDQSR